MLLEITSVSLLIVLSLKELVGASSNERISSRAEILYVAIIPLLLLFTIAAITRIAEIPSLSG